MRTDSIQYYLKDHLGSIQVVVDTVGEIVSYDDGVYPALGGKPWGIILNGRSTNTAYTNAKYKFTSEERDVETGYDYFGARYYDSRIGRWLQVDPLFEKHPDYSPYNYVLNNPLILIDPDGKQVVVSDPFFNYGFGKGFFGTLGSTVTGLYESVTHPLATGESMWQAVTNPSATFEAMGNAVGDWAGRLMSANPIESGEAFGEAAAIVGETFIGTKGASKISYLKTLTKFENTVTEVGKVNRVVKVIKEYLGEGVELKKNKAGDIILMSKDKKIRFDINNPGGDNPHFHIEKYENGRWIDATDEHRIYFKEE